MMFQVQGGSKQTCSLLAVFSRNSENKQKQDEDAGLRYPVPEIASSGRLEVQTLSCPCIEEFRRTFDSFQPNFVYLQGEWLPNNEVGSLVWAGVDLSTAEAVARLLAPHCQPLFIWSCQMERSLQRLFIPREFLM
ncbi:hypothetical protein NMG60_11003991 [Bertholletia excelsa]